MDTEQLTEIESTLSITLPDDYRELMLAYPHELEAVAEYELVNDAQQLIAINVNARGYGPGIGGWRDSFFITGTDGGEEMFFLDTSRARSPVFCLAVENHAISERASSLAEFVRMLVEAAGEG
jgi:hypothetical protein